MCCFLKSESVREGTTTVLSIIAERVANKFWINLGRKVVHPACFAVKVFTRCMFGMMERVTNTPPHHCAALTHYDQTLNLRSDRTTWPTSKSLNLGVTQ